MIEIPEINPHMYSHLIFNETELEIQLGKKIVFYTSGTRTTGQPYGERRNINLYLTLYIKLALNELFLHIKTKTTKFLKENIGKMLTLS